MSEQVPGYDPETLQTPAIFDLVTAYQRIPASVEDIVMVEPGEKASTPDAYPHTMACEQRLRKAADLMSQLVEELLLAQQGK